MKRATCILLTLCLLAATVGTLGAAPAKKEIALICAYGGGGINDRGFFQGAWTGITKFCKETGKTCAYYEPAQAAEDSFMETVDLAVLNGAKIVVTAGADFIGLMPKAFAAYPDVLFLCNEIPVIEPTKNSVIYTFKAQESGFLAGVCAVYEGYTKIGQIMGKQIPPVMAFGYGFMQGVNWAAGQLGVKNVELKYWYSNSFEPSPEIQAFAAAWYANGIEIIFASSGGAGASIWAAAEAAGKPCIGVDTDQSGNSKSIITSAIKLVEASTYTGLKQWVAEKFPVNQVIALSAKDGATGLAMDNARTKKFTKAVYQKYLKMMIGDVGGMASGILTGNDAKTPMECWEKLKTHNIKFTYVE